jgi:hypothetical protein
MKSRLVLAILPVAACLCTLAAPPGEKPATVADAVRAVMLAEEALREVPLREVVAAATGKRILPFQPDKVPADAAAKAHLTRALDQLLEFLNAPQSPVRGLRRINEASRAAEEKLAALLHAGDFTCAFARTAGGEGQRAGYPDLRFVHQPTGRVYYLDPKLYEASSETSTLRTFYYEPRALTGKITEDACHLTAGVAHDGKDGAWRFTAWRLADLHDFRVSLKAEFQASNRELYREGLTVGKSRP